MLFVDVDGVISLFPARPDMCPGARFLMVDGIVHLISTSAGEHLRRLEQAYELVWCTGWEEKANEYLPQALGLGAPLPYLVLGHDPAAPRRHWKLAAIERYAGEGRPLAWIDDDHDDRCRTWAERRTAPTLLITTKPSEGLTRAQVEQLLAWAARES